jgi:hypothetical protein
MLRKHVESFAIQAREFADEAARFGRLISQDNGHVKPEVLSVWKEVKRRQELCTAAADELDRHLAGLTGPQLMRSAGHDSP